MHKRDLAHMIPVSEPWITAAEHKLVNEALASGWISSAGKYIETFEQSWAEYCGRRHGVAVSNGTTALQLAVASLDLQPGDEVIMPAFTIISCAQAILYSGAVPVIVDIDPETGGMDTNQVATKITAKTRAIMPVHIYGHPMDIDPILELAKQYKLAVIEDAAEVHGAEYLQHRNSNNPIWRRCGSFGELSCFSFYANKLITTGEGGMVLCDNDQLAAKLRTLRNLGFKAPRRFEHEQLGFNFRLTNLQAALGVSQIQRMPEIIAKKRWIAAQYQQRLAQVPGIKLPTQAPWAKHVYWVYGLLLDEGLGVTAEAFAQALAERGIQTRPYFLGMHQQPVFQRKGLFIGESYPRTEQWSQQGLYLPAGLTITEAQIATVCEAVNKVVTNVRTQVKENSNA